MTPNLSPTIDSLTRALERSTADPVRVDRLTLLTLRDTLVDLRRVLHEPDVHLTATERTLYKTLAVADGRPLSGLELAEAVNCRSVPSLWVHIRRLRAKLADANERIDTVRGVGYVLTRQGGLL